MLHLLAVCLYLAGFIAAAHAALNARTAQGALAWTLSLVMFPLISFPAYLVFGRNRFAGHAEAFRASKSHIDELRTTIRSNLSPWRIEPAASPSWHQALIRLADFGLTHGNRVRLLVNGEATFDDMLAGIATAERYVLFQFYMIHSDGLGNRVKDALIAKAAQGVRVCVLYDEVGSSGLDDAYVKDLQCAGVAVSAFRPTQGWRNRFQLNFRNHRKMVVVDGRLGWIGGHNVGDEYLGLDPEFSPWRDTHVRIEGPAVLQLQAAILTDWYWATRELPELDWMPQPAEDSDQHVMILPTGPTGHLETASLLFVSALMAAHERIWLTAPYFVPDDGVMKALQIAALRGVDVRIITSGKADSLPVHLAAFHYIHKLRDLGIRFYAYRPGFLHQKVLLIDDDVSAVGTHNFDNRSFRLNFEVTALMVDKPFAAEMAAMFERDFEHAGIIDPRDLESRPIWWWLAVRVARLASPVL